MLLSKIPSITHMVFDYKFDMVQTKSVNMISNLNNNQLNINSIGALKNLLHLSLSGPYILGP